MSQMTIYLDDDLEKQVRDIAAGSNISISQFVARALHHAIQSTWPAEVRDMPGSWKSFPDGYTIRKESGQDLPRESL